MFKFHKHKGGKAVQTGKPICFSLCIFNLKLSTIYVFLFLSFFKKDFYETLHTPILYLWVLCFSGSDKTLKIVQSTCLQSSWKELQLCNCWSRGALWAFCLVQCHFYSSLEKISFHLPMPFVMILVRISAWSLLGIIGKQSCLEKVFGSRACKN